MQKMWGLRFSDALAAGERAILKMQAEGWKAPVIEGVREWDDAWSRDLLRRAQRNVAGVQRFIQAKGYPFSAEWLMGRFGVGAEGDRLIVPLFGEDWSLVGLKHRRLDGSDHLYAFPGSHLTDALYGGGEDDGQSEVILVEGESDCWVAAYGLSLRYAVRGLASGAGQPPKPAHILAGRDVHICFDGDAAGRLGATRWAKELRRIGARVTVWDLPDGEDVASLGGVSWLPGTLG